METETHLVGDVLIVTSGVRIGATESSQFMRAVRDSVDPRVNQVIVDMGKTQFIGLPTIKFLHELAVDLRGRGGRFVLVAPSEKILRQIHIFSSLDPMEVFESLPLWEGSEWTASHRTSTLPVVGEAS